MTKNKLFLKKMLATLTLFSVGALSYAEDVKKTESFNDKSIVGELEHIQIEEIDIDFIARIDTGAAMTSMHAKNINVVGIEKEHDDIRKHLGEKVSFTAINEKGEEASYEADIVKIVKIRNSIGVERRFIVNLTLNWNGEKKMVNVNLRDREELDYKLLIGRNWLIGDYIVDIDKKSNFEK